MTRQSFSLIPSPGPNIPNIAITGTIARQNSVLTLHYSLTGDMKKIFLPSRSAHPCRKDELWKRTCFEFFLAVKDQPQYWEFNLSPSGDWNVYRMDAYRRIGFREETSIQRLQFEVEKSERLFTLEAAIDLSPIPHMEQDLEIGVTTIIQTQDGNETYWALVHPAPQADFHKRESFTLALAGRTRLSPRSAPES